MTETFEITRKIEIDAGHRVTHHGSKCRNLHGHRYVIEATCIGNLISEGEQEGMVLDFAFLKEEMVNTIDKYCDHTLMLWVQDPMMVVLLHPDVAADAAKQILHKEDPMYKITPRHDDEEMLSSICVLPDVPTAENLAKIWFHVLAPRVTYRSMGNAVLKRLRVWETPNCWADYESKDHMSALIQRGAKS